MPVMQGTAEMDGQKQKRNGLSFRMMAAAIVDVLHPVTGLAQGRSTNLKMQPDASRRLSTELLTMNSYKIWQM